MRFFLIDKALHNLAQVSVMRTSLCKLTRGCSERASRSCRVVQSTKQKQPILRLELK